MSYKSVELVFQTVSQNSQERICVALCYSKSRLCSFRHRCVHVDFVKFLRRPILKNLNKIVVNVCLKQYNNNVFRENKPPAPTRIGKGQLENLSAFFCHWLNKYDLPIAIRFYVTCIYQSNVKFCLIKL